MTIETTRVKVEVEGDQLASHKAAKIAREMDVLASKARTARAATEEAELSGRRVNSLLRRAQDKGLLPKFGAGGADWGPMKLGPGGFGVNMGMMRATSFGLGLGVASLVNRTVGGALQSYFEVRDQFRDDPNLTWGEVAQNGVLNASRSVHSLTGLETLIMGLYQVRGYSADQAASTYEQFFMSPMQIRHAREAALRTSPAAQAAIDANYRIRAERRRAAEEALFSANTDALAKQLAGLKFTEAHSKLPPSIARRLLDDQARIAKAEAFVRVADGVRKLGPADGS